MNFRQLLTLAAVTILVGTEVLGASLAFGWAVGGLFQLGREMTMGIIGLCMVAGAWATWKFFAMAAKVEPQYP